MKTLKHLLTLVLLLSSYTLVAQNPLEDDKIFVVVEDAPMFPGCEKEKKADRNTCANSKLFNYLSDNLTYPEIARKKGITGRVIVQFSVEKDGSITNVKVIRGIGGGCDEVAKELIAGMPKWNPAKQRGRPVRVQFTLPVSFTLEKKVVD